MTYGDSRYAPLDEPPPPPPPPLRSPGAKIWVGVLATLCVLVVLVACAAGGYFLLQDDRSTQAVNDSPSPSVWVSSSTGPSPVASPTAPVDISSRETDPVPLSVAEIFPTAIAVVEDPTTDEVREYPVVATEELTDCTLAAIGQLVQDLANLGCTQVIRAAMESPDGDYGFTAGLINLAEQGSTEHLTIEGNSSVFLGLPAPGASENIRAVTTVVFPQEYGHYLAYLVICRADGGDISADEPGVTQIVSDILLTYLFIPLAAREEG